MRTALGKGAKKNLATEKHAACGVLCTAVAPCSLLADTQTGNKIRVPLWGRKGIKEKGHPGAEMAPRRVLVLGGSGFVGRAVCREGVRRGWTVTSLSRRGAPSDVDRDGLLGRVDWRRGSALDAETQAALLAEGQDYIVHSIGTLFEGNPLYSAYKASPVEYAGSYKALIRDTAEVAVAAAVAAQEKIRAFAYVSAARYGALGSALLPRYMEMKGEAEELLLRCDAFRTVIARPGFMFGSDRWLTVPMSAGVAAVCLFTGGLLPRPLSVDTVARAILAELDDTQEEVPKDSEEEHQTLTTPSQSSPAAASIVLEVADIARRGAA